MIGLDTNILVRFFARDDPVLTPKADALLRSLAHGARGYVATVVLAELVWVMSRVYGAKQSEIVRIVEHLTGSEELVVESHVTVRSALKLFIATSSDFVDCLILRTCQSAGCDHTATFDRKASRTIGMRLIP